MNFSARKIVNLLINIFNMNASDFEYDKSYANWKGWEKLFKFNSLDSIYFEGEFNASSLKGLRVLDIGFGSGSFMAWSRQCGANISGCELIEDLCLAGMAAGYDTRFGKLNIFSEELNNFDLIVALDVMEHIPTENLVDFMDAVKSLLKPGGTFIARVPNGGSPWGLTNQYGDVTHVSVLTPGRFQQLANYSNLHFVSCKNAYRVLHPDSRLMGKLKFFLRDSYSYCLSFIFGLWRVPLDQNIVAIFKKNY